MILNLYDYVYDTIILGIMTAKNIDDARSYLNRQYALVSRIECTVTKGIILKAIDAAKCTYNNTYKTLI